MYSIFGVAVKVCIVFSVLRCWCVGTGIYSIVGVGVLVCWCVGVLVLVLLVLSVLVDWYWYL